MPNSSALASNLSTQRDCGVTSLRVKPGTSKPRAGFSSAGVTSGSGRATFLVKYFPGLFGPSSGRPDSPVCIRFEIEAFHRFLMALSLRSGMLCVINANFCPCAMYPLKISCSSSAVRGPFKTLEARLLNQRSWHWFGVRCGRAVASFGHAVVACFREYRIDALLSAKGDLCLGAIRNVRRNHVPLLPKLPNQLP
jgi:hypothetical protein